MCGWRASATGTSGGSTRRRGRAADPDEGKPDRRRAPAAGEVLVANGPAAQSRGASTRDRRVRAPRGHCSERRTTRLAAGHGRRSARSGSPTRRDTSSGELEPEPPTARTSSRDPAPDRTSLIAPYESVRRLRVRRRIALGGGRRDSGATLWRLDPADGQARREDPLPFVPAGVAAGEGAVWVTSLLDDTVARIDPATNRIVRHDPRRARRGQRSPRATARLGRELDRRHRLPRSTRRRTGSSRRSRSAAARRHRRRPGRRLGDGRRIPQQPRSRPRADPDRRALGLQGPLLRWTRDSTLAGAELALLERGRHARRARTDGRGGRRLDRRSPGPPLLRLLGHDNRLRALAKPAGSSTRSASHPDRPARRNEGLALQDFARRRPDVAFVNGTSSAQLHQSGAELLQLPHGRRRLDGRPRHVRVPARSAGAAPSSSSISRTTSSTGRRPPDSSRSSARSAGRSRSGSGSRRDAGLLDVIQQVPASGVDGFFFATYPETVIAFARAYRGLRGDVSAKALPGTSSTGRPEAASVGRVRGLVGGGAIGRGFARYVHRYRRRFPGTWPSPAATSTSSTTTPWRQRSRRWRRSAAICQRRRRLMSALARVRLSSPLGPITLDERGRRSRPTTCSRRQADPLDPRRRPHVRRPLHADRSAPDPDAACVKRTPPPWAR